MAVAILTLKCKEIPKKLLLHVNDLIVQKSLLYEQKLQKEVEIPFSQFAGRLKIEVESFLTACTGSEN